MSVTGPWVTQKTQRSLQIVAPRSASAGSSRQKSMAAQMLPRSFRIAWEQVDLTGILGRDRARKVSDPVGMTRSQPVFVACLAEPVEAELPQRLQEPQTAAVLLSSPEHGLVNERRDEVRDVGVVEAVASADRRAASSSKPPANTAGAAQSRRSGSRSSW